MEWMRYDLRIILANRIILGLLAGPAMAVATKAAAKQAPRIQNTVEKVPTPLIASIYCVGLIFLQDKISGWSRRTKKQCIRVVAVVLFIRCNDKDNSLTRLQLILWNKGSIASTMLVCYLWGWTSKAFVTQIILLVSIISPKLLFLTTTPRLNQLRGPICHALNQI